MIIKVMMMEVPNVPMGDDWNDDCVPYAVIAMDQYSSGWGWIDLEGATKHEIGQYMLDYKVQTNTWYYLSIVRPSAYNAVRSFDD